MFTECAESNSVSMPVRRVCPTATTGLRPVFGAGRLSLSEALRRSGVERRQQVGDAQVVVRGTNSLFEESDEHPRKHCCPCASLLGCFRVCEMFRGSG